MNEYEKQAEDFLQKTGTILEWKFERFGEHGVLSKNEKRLIYRFTLKRGSREYSSTFGDSIAKSWAVLLGKKCPIHHRTSDDIKRYNATGENANRFGDGRFRRTQSNGLPWGEVLKLSTPSSYDLLAVLTKSDPGTIDQFAFDYGISGKPSELVEIYTAVKNEWVALERLYTNDELAELAEIA